MPRRRARFSYTAGRPALPGRQPAANEPMPARVKAALATNGFALRLSNTPKSIGELVNDPHAILLENALIDSSRPVDFTIPEDTCRRGRSGRLHRAGARAGERGVSRVAGAGGRAEDRFGYIPNNAYLVRLTGGGAGSLAAVRWCSR